MSQVDVTGIPKDELLAALVNASKVFGSSHLDSRATETMTVERAGEILAQRGNRLIDYVDGRLVQMRLSVDELNATIYDEKLGKNHCQSVVDGLRERFPKSDNLDNYDLESPFRSRRSAFSRFSGQDFTL